MRELKEGRDKSEKTHPDKTKQAPFWLSLCLTVTSSHWGAQRIYDGKKEKGIEGQKEPFPFLTEDRGVSHV